MLTTFTETLLPAAIAVLLAACATTAHGNGSDQPAPPAAAPGPQLAAPPAKQKPPSGVAGPLALGAWAQTLPQCPEDAAQAERAFCGAAARAVRATLQEDSDDPSQLQALMNALDVEPGLARLAPLWASALANASARAELLAKLSRPLRLLRRSMAEAYLDPRSNLYRGIETAQCRRAFDQLAAAAASWQDLVVTVEPLGTWPLSTLRRLCLQDRRLPPH